MSAADERIEVELRRLTDRLRGAPLAQAEAGAPAVREVLHVLADAAAAVEQRDVDGAPVLRPVPELPVAALGDQLAVLGADLRLAADGLSPDTAVRTAAGTAPLDALLTDVADRLTELRRTL